MVVLAIAAVVTSITVTGFRSLTDGNRRTTCQTNMSQLYASLRLYAADEGGVFPYFNPENDDDSNRDDGRGIGLWALYTFPSDQDPDKLAPVEPLPSDALGDSKPIDRYLRSAKVLHCPADTDVQLEGGTTLNRTSLIIPDPDNEARKIFNREYMSYHSFDSGTPEDPTDDERAYQSMRTTDWGAVGSAQRDLWKRQLLHRVPDNAGPGGNDSDSDLDVIIRPPTDDTIITWCAWHRGVRDYDNVLFYDGSIQILPREDQDGHTGYLRKPNAPK
jgi:type II secretory pathway pseudopilin PulG